MDATAGEQSHCFSSVHRFFLAAKFILIMIKCLNFKRIVLDIQNYMMKTKNGRTCSTTETETSKLRTVLVKMRSFFCFTPVHHSRVAFNSNCGLCVMALKANIKRMYLSKKFQFSYQSFSG